MMSAKIKDLFLLDVRLDAQQLREGLLTFDGWIRRDRFVVKGSKAVAFNSHGKALFREDQTTMDEYDPHFNGDCGDDWGHPGPGFMGVEF